MRRGLLLGLAGFLLAALAAQACASAKESGFGYRGWGIRGGISAFPKVGGEDRDQIFLGAHLDLGEFIPNLRFKPNVTVGFGDDMTLLAFSPDVSYAFPVEDLGKLYVGGILALEWWTIDDLPAGSTDDDTEAEFGFHVIGGVEFQTLPLFFELNLGLSDNVPDVKVAAGFSF